MTDKDKIREEVERLLNHVKDSNFESDSGAFYYLKDLLDFIDSLQDKKEPVSDDFEEALAKEWKGYVDRGAATVDALEDNTQELAFAKGFYRGWNYPKQPVSEDFEKTFISMVNATHENNGSYSLHEYAQKLYNIARDTVREPSFEKEFEEVWSVYCKNAPIRFSGDKDKLEGIARHFANWQKEQMMENSVC